MTPSTGCDTPLDSDKPKPPRSTLVSRNVTIAGHRTSVRLEPEMWSGLAEIGRRERTSLHDICTAVAGRKQANTSLTAAIRVFAMAYFRAAATEDGHVKAGHGYGVVIAIAPGAAMGTPRPTNTNGLPSFTMAANKMDNTRRF